MPILNFHCKLGLFERFISLVNPVRLKIINQNPLERANYHDFMFLMYIEAFN